MKPLQAIILNYEYCSCEKLKKLLVSFQNIFVANCFTKSHEALRNIFENKPDVLFLDIKRASYLSGLKIPDRLDSSQSRPYIIMVTGHPQYSIKAIKHEVFDYLIKPVEVDELKNRIERLLEHTTHRHTNLSIEFSGLSTREQEILQLVLDGNSSEEIAERLFISVNTVNTHRRNIFKKTGARSVVDLC